MAVDWDRVNAPNLRAFGDESTYTNRLGVSSIVTGILETGIQDESLPPGDGSAYARFWTKQEAFSPAPEPGETITVGNSVYKIIRLESDVGEGLWLLLRLHREL